MDVDSYRIDQVLVTRLHDSEGHVLQHPASSLSAVAAVVATETAQHAAPAATAASDAPAAPRAPSTTDS